MPINSPRTAAPAVRLFHSLADPVRLAILRLLADGDYRVVDLTDELGLAQSTVSGHLASLRAAGIVGARPHGRSTYYHLVSADVWTLLAAADDLLQAAGSSTALCPDRHRPQPFTPCGTAVRGCLAHHGWNEPHDHDPRRPRAGRH